MKEKKKPSKEDLKIFTDWRENEYQCDGEEEVHHPFCLCPECFD